MFHLVTLMTPFFEEKITETSWMVKYFFFPKDYVLFHNHNKILDSPYWLLAKLNSIRCNVQQTYHLYILCKRRESSNGHKS